ncbi:uncharacterized protein LOC143020044 isoform X1 [Oratosquilla oratoria]|uniref:uncharacterized protein LOC143020044 isoform X1 n=1 Tax=Oratosquilla oratoria TaxID=337810 RepID=UPI003F75A73A
MNYQAMTRATQTIHNFKIQRITAKMTRECKHSPDSFCYTCGSVTLRQCKRQLTQHVKKLGELYFGCKVGDLGKRWAPHICCVRCASSLFCLGQRQTGLASSLAFQWSGWSQRTIQQIATSD